MKNFLFDLYGTLIEIHTDEQNGAFWKKIAAMLNFGDGYTESSTRIIIKDNGGRDLNPGGVYDLAVSDSGIAATVKETLDYGKEKFLKCSVCETTVYVKCDEEHSGEVHLLPDLARIGIVETERAIKII